VTRSARKFDPSPARSVLRWYARDSAQLESTLLCLPASSSCCSQSSRFQPSLSPSPTSGPTATRTTPSTHSQMLLLYEQNSSMKRCHFYEESQLEHLPSTCSVSSFVSAMPTPQFSKSCCLRLDDLQAVASAKQCCPSA